MESSREVGTAVYAFGDFRLSARDRVLWRGDRRVPLTPKALELLLVLVQSAGTVRTKEQLLAAVWPDTFVEEANLTQTVFMVRKALGETPGQRFIATVPGRGYRFAQDVRVVPAEVEPRAPGGETRATAGTWVWGAAIAALVIVAVVIAALTPSLRRRNAAEGGGRSMLAVLPFENLTGDPGQEYLSDGLTEEMIAQLGNADPQTLGVIARTSVMHYKTSQAPLDQVGRELGVQYVLEGSVRRDAGKVRVTAQLVRTSDQSHLWARQYDRETTNLLELQGEIAGDVARQIRLTVGKDTEEGATSGARSGTRSYEAYDHYLEGRFFWNKRTPEGFEEAIRHFEKAIEDDPGYALAYAGLADCYALLPGYAMVPQTAYLPKARAAAEKALHLDDNLAEAHTSLALIAENYDLDWETAEREYRRAIELNPNYATAHHWFAECLTWQGRFDEALAESERARQLDPLSLIIAADNGMIFYFSRRYDRAEEKLKAVLEMDPTLPRAHMVRDVYVERGKFEEALADIESFSPRSTPWDRTYVLGRSGRAAEARRSLAELEALGERQPVDAGAMAWAYVGVGEKDRALAWLEKAYEEHSSIVLGLKVEPGWDPLRGDPRFQDLLRKVHLAGE